MSYEDIMEGKGVVIFDDTEDEFDEELWLFYNDPEAYAEI